jgi:hypothetical protein
VTDETIGKVMRGEVIVRGRDVRDGVPVFVASRPLFKAEV